MAFRMHLIRCRRKAIWLAEVLAFLHPPGFEDLNVTVRWTVACRQHDGGNTIFFFRQSGRKCQRIPGGHMTDLPGTALAPFDGCMLQNQLYCILSIFIILSELKCLAIPEPNSDIWAFCGRKIRCDLLNIIPAIALYGTPAMANDRAS